MLSAKDNELITQTGPGTPMGDLFRRYWLPVMLSRELTEREGPPIRVQVLGETLVAFRDAEGKVGVVDQFCPHRGAALYYGINHGDGLMCIYHGWRFNVEGRCIDMPSDLPESTFKDRVRVPAYPTYEAAGMVWAYFGPADKQPVQPNLYFCETSAEMVNATKTPVYCNYLQSLEGNIDSTHLGTLHAQYKNQVRPVDGDGDRPGHPPQPLASYLRSGIRYARIDVQDTAYGFRLIAIRDTPAGNQFIRINNHILPTITLVAPVDPWRDGGIVIIVPKDDENCWRFQVTVRRDHPFTEEERGDGFGSRRDPDNPELRLQRLDNNFLMDRVAQKATAIAGITGIAEQDYCVTESMGPIMDRSREHLYPADNAIIRYRQIMLKAARDLQEGIDPPGLDPEIPFNKIRSEDIIIGPDDDPWLVACHAGESTRPGERLH
jgi:phthalate 4,5-dioxygenase oxygenase subunit